MKLTCIICPMSCQMEVKKNDNNFSVNGNNCIRGEKYAISEITSPSRIVTGLIKTENGVASVKTTDLVPKDKIFDILEQIAKIRIKNVNEGDVVIENILNLNVDIVVTRCPIKE